MRVNFLCLMTNCTKNDYAIEIEVVVVAVYM